MKVKDDHRSKFSNFTAMIILHFHLQPQFKDELFHILHIRKIGKFTAMIIRHFHLQPQFKNELFHTLHIKRF